MERRLDLRPGKPETRSIVMLIGERVEAAMRRHGLLRCDEGLLVAVSGGPDSVALLHLLDGMRRTWNLRLEVAHLQHGMRGAEGMDDARFAAALAQKLGLPFHLKEIDLPAMKAEAGKGNLEALARAERYRFFADVVRERKLDKVATAHTQDDQAETVLMWLLRGAGGKGLGGMAPLSHLDAGQRDQSEKLTVIRPLIESSKAEILEYLQENGLFFKVDRTNQDPAWLRNWLRLELLPEIRRRTGENVAERLNRLSALMREENQFLDQLARDRYRAVGGTGGLDRRMLLREPKALRRRVVRLWIEQVRGHLRGLDFVHVEELLHVAEAKAPQGRVSIPGGWEVVREYDTLTLAKNSRGAHRLCYSYELPIGNVLRIPEAGVEISAERLVGAGGARPAASTEAVFDLQGLTGMLVLRNFRPGDRIRPLGMSGRKKVKDLFIDHKVPQSQRAKLPLLAMGQEILWVPGYGRSELGRVTEKTRSLLRIKVVSIGA
jgi:tRNA(Ile)-lysidine synthase